jgi:hypothetical protein
MRFAPCWIQASVFLFENPIFTNLKRHVPKRHVYRLPDYLSPMCTMCNGGPAKQLALIQEELLVLRYLSNAGVLEKWRRVLQIVVTVTQQATRKTKPGLKSDKYFHQES